MNIRRSGITGLFTAGGLGVALLTSAPAHASVGGTVVDSVAAYPPGPSVTGEAAAFPPGPTRTGGVAAFPPGPTVTGDAAAFPPGPSIIGPDV